MYTVFISYSSKDEAKAKDLVDRIEIAGISCWIACRDILISGNFAAAISQAIRNARVVVVLLSESSNRSKHVTREVSLAVDNDVTILPVALENMKLNDGMEYLLSIVERIGPLVDEDTLYKKTVDWLERYFTVREEDDTAESPAAKANVVPRSGEARLDFYDADMVYVGCALRSKVHQLGLWHRTFHCWLYRNDGGKALIWVQRRSPAKEDFPNMLDITVGRHLLEGETDRDASERVSDELGAKVDFDGLKYIGVRSHSERADGYINNELNSVFLYEAPYPLSKLDPDSSEVSAVLQLEAADMLALFTGSRKSAYAIELPSGSEGNIKQCKVTSRDFVPHDREYYREICLTVIKLCAEEKTSCSDKEYNED